MKATPRIVIVVVAALCFGGSFISTVIIRAQEHSEPAQKVPSSLAARLELDANQLKLIAEHDPEFVTDVDALQAKLDSARESLASAFETEGITGEEIEVRFEAVLAIHYELERRVLKYVVAVRDHLTPRQRHRLLGLCAKNVREHGRRWRHGWGHRARSDDQSVEHGPAEGRGRGHGRGGGRGFRGGRGP